MTDLTASIAGARRIVVKVGSRSIVGASLHEGATQGGGRFTQLGAQIAQLRGEGRSLVMVSSGAVALGRGRLGYEAKPKAIAELQACAAVGQTLLMQGWERALGARSIAVGQLLLSHADLEDRERYLNARAALDALIELGAVPIINENDTVAVDEIRFGDNDQLAAMVCTLAGADLLVLLSDVEGLLDADGGRVAQVDDIELAQKLTFASAGDVGSGGMASKLEAARRAARRGVPVVIADARDPEVLARIVRGEDVGTRVAPLGARMTSRKHWIAYTLRPRGDLLLDDGAVAAIRAGGRSLLPAGILGVRGDFGPGDPVVLRDARGIEIGRGLCRYAVSDAAKLAGAKTTEIEERLGFHGGDEVVHRDDLVVS
ncbi:MAG: glutamate 5-kinase [Sandaracinaceae bacterium]